MGNFLELLEEMIDTASFQFEEMVGVRVSTFEEAGLLTSNEGLVVNFPDGTQYQVTVTLSRVGQVQREACPGCGCLPGDGTTPGCDHPGGCGVWKDA